MAVFSNLTEKLQDAFARMKKKGKLTEEDVNAALREVQIALLEADVNYKVVKKFIRSVREKAVGEEVLKSLSPAQQVIKIVNEELTELMGGSGAEISFSPVPPTIVMLCGLQGTGKSTTCAKLANLYQKKNKKVLMVAADIYRPAAIEQLKSLGESLDIPVFTMGEKNSPVDIALAGKEHARKKGFDLVILDTAGRLHLDEEMMQELRDIKSRISPHEILLTVDAMTGQDAVNVAKKFNDEMGIDGTILTKLDGDARGGAAISTKAVTDKPIKFAGIGEKVEDIEVFHPDRMASRILGMGDMLSLIEKAQTSYDEQKAKDLEEKIRKQEFDLEDFLEQLQQMQNMGSMEEILNMIPGMGGKAMKNVQVDEKELVYFRAIIQSMTPRERQHPEIINARRKKRIAAGSGTSVQKVNKLLKQFKDSQRMMKQIGQMGKKGKKMNFPGLFS